MHTTETCRLLSGPRPSLSHSCCSSTLPKTCKPERAYRHAKPAVYLALLLLLGDLAIDVPGSAGQTVTVGIRPEGFAPAASGFKVVVEVVEVVVIVVSEHV